VREALDGAFGDAQAIRDIPDGQVLEKSEHHDRTHLAR
jgi:hypothetical protein